MAAARIAQTSVAAPDRAASRRPGTTRPSRTRSRGGQGAELGAEGGPVELVAAGQEQQGVDRGRPVAGVAGAEPVGEGEGDPRPDPGRRPRPAAAAPVRRRGCPRAGGRAVAAGGRRSGHGRRAPRPASRPATGPGPRASSGSGSGSSPSRTASGGRRGTRRRTMPAGTDAGLRSARRRPRSHGGEHAGPIVGHRAVGAQQPPRARPGRTDHPRHLGVGRLAAGQPGGQPPAGGRGEPAGAGKDRRVRVAGQPQQGLLQVVLPGAPALGRGPPGAWTGARPGRGARSRWSGWPAGAAAASTGRRRSRAGGTAWPAAARAPPGSAAGAAARRPRRRPWPRAACAPWPGASPRPGRPSPAARAR
jgi:hypothetical protein